MAKDNSKFITDNSSLLIYQSDDGLIKIETQLEDETVWLTQEEMATLFDKGRSTITEHILNIYKEKELEQNPTCRKFRRVRKEGSRTVEREMDHYNLDVIISVGYRVKSIQGTRFRQWATQRLREYIVKGFTMNDEMLKNAGGGNYFDELLERIRDIRSSEKVFWRKVLDIYATSIDYDPSAESSQLFFKTVQNKMNWAAHGHTAAELVYKRISAEKPFLGLTNFSGDKPNKSEISVAKNYLKKDELEVLNRMVTAYLEIAELQALNRKPMYMKDWITRLDDFLTMTGNDILENAEKVSREKMLKKAEQEYEKYKEQTQNDLSKVEKDFIRQIEQTAKTLKNKKNEE